MDYVAHFKAEIEAGRMSARQALEGADTLKQMGTEGKSAHGMTPHQLLVLAKAIREMVIAHEARQINLWQGSLLARRSQTMYALFVNNLLHSTGHAWLDVCALCRLITEEFGQVASVARMVAS